MLSAVIIGGVLSLVSIVFTNVIPLLAGTDPYPSYLQVLPPLVLSLTPGLLLRKSGVARKVSLLTGLVVGVSWFVFVLARLGRLDWFGDMLKGLGQRHATYGVRPEHYPLVGVVLLETFADFLGKHWTQAGTPPHSGG